MNKIAKITNLHAVCRCAWKKSDKSHARYNFALNHECNNFTEIYHLYEPLTHHWDPKIWQVLTHTMYNIA